MADNEIERIEAGPAKWIPIAISMISVCIAIVALLLK